MKSTPRAYLALGLIPWLAWMACAPKSTIAVNGAADRTAAAEAAVRELAVRYAVTDLREDRPVFVAFGASRQQASDPPAAFLERLTDLPHVLEPVSAYPGDARRHPVLVLVDTPDWVGDAEARIKVTRIRFGVGAADGFTAQARWAEGRWVADERPEHWST